MGIGYKIIIITLLILSVAFFVAGIIFFVRQLIKNKSKSLNQKLYIPTLCVFISVLWIRFSTAFYGILSVPYTDESEGLHWFEGLLNSFVHTLQTFSLDAEYTETITIGKELFENEFGSELLAGFYGFFSAILNVCAPLMVGAILLGILASVFPHLSLWFMARRSKFIFSELNDRAITLAEDIIREAKKEKKGIFSNLPLIVFTDAYVDNDNEASSELHQKAKKIGAVCIKDDILTLKFLKASELYYLLMDDCDINNIHTLTTLTTEQPKRWNNTCQVNIYIFSQNREVGSIVKKVYINEGERLSNVIIKVVQEYTSIAYNLFNDMPLFHPLFTKYSSDPEKEKELTLTIVGGGLIGTEIFLCAYWCGQILDCDLTINVITENANKFKEQINHINPEILQSGVLNGKTNDSLLKVYPYRDVYSKPYANFAFFSLDVASGDLSKVLCEKGENEVSLIFSDYFVVALGSDERNMTIASEINRAAQRECLNAGIGKKRKPVIACTVYDPNTKGVLNSMNTNNPGALFYAFAALTDIYSCKNIFMNHVNEPAFNFNKMHNSGDVKKFLKDEYNWWSSIARVLHRKYKIYSALLNKGIILKEITDIEIKQYWELVDSDRELCDRLFWLEHRRWNAFLRSKGFTAPTETQWEQYAWKDGLESKNVDLKLHPCIVECSEKYNIKDDDWDSDSYKDNKELDYLDIVSIMVYQKKAGLGLNPNKEDYKIWDEPMYDKD